MNQEQLWNLLEATKSQIRSFDSKAQVALGINSFLAGLLGSQLIKSTEYAAEGMLIRFWITFIFSVVALGLVAYSFFWSLRTVHPQLRLSQPKSHFFFCHLVERYGRDFYAAANALESLDEKTASHEIATQIATNSVICDAKATRCRRALFSSGFALVLYLLTLLPFGSMAYEANHKTHLPQTILQK